ncbi:MAG: polysaccharide biosynthesis/export family protein [Bacteroidia bacterium]
MRNLLFILLLGFLFSCRSLAPNRMFQTPNGYEYAKDTGAVNPNTTYLIQSNDKLELHIYSNDGFRLVDITQNTMTTTNIYENFSYVVDDSGNVKFPIIGNLNIKGLTVKEAQSLLESKYTKFYNDPFVILRVTNRHVLVFLGDNGHGVLVNLQNDNTSLFEALALAGGLTENSKAYKIKIVRGDLHNPKIYLADIYSLQGLRNSELRILSNDIIYIEAAPDYKQRVFQQLTPIVGIITAVLLVLNLVK